MVCTKKKRNISFSYVTKNCVVICMERVKGIEPSSSAWKAEVLPLNYTRIYNLYGAGEGNRTLIISLEG